MKKIILFSAMLLSASLTFAQTSPNVHAKTSNSATTEQEVIKSAETTPFYFNGSIVYRTTKGTYFVVKHSKKSGNYYKQYVTVENTAQSSK